MKELLLVLLILASIPLKGQELNNFRIESGKIEWVKVFNTELSQNDIFDKLRENGKIIGLEMDKDKIIARIEKLEADFRGYGLSEMKTPIYISRSWIEGLLIFEFKEGRYRVVFREINLVQKYSDPLSEMGEITSLDNYGLSKNGFRKSFEKDASKILDYTFSKEFYFKRETSEDW